MNEVLWMECLIWCWWVSLETSRLAKGAKILARCVTKNSQDTSWILVTLSVSQSVRQTVRHATE